MEIDLKRIEQVLAERPRRVRGAGRTTAAVWKALCRLSMHPDDVFAYLTRTEVQGEYAFAVARQMVQEHFKGMSCSSLRMILARPSDGYLCFQRAASRAEVVHAARSGFLLCDDLGEWADQEGWDSYPAAVTAFCAGQDPVVK